MVGEHRTQLSGVQKQRDCQSNS